jgi:hypothetical protein
VVADAGRLRQLDLGVLNDCRVHSDSSQKRSS